MKKLKQLWRYYFNAEIRALKKLKKVMIILHSKGDLLGMCDAISSEANVSCKHYDILHKLLVIYAVGDINKYFFPSGELQPRLDWCDMVINKIKTK